MSSPSRGPQSPLEDRYQRGESERPREIVDTFARGDPYRANGMSAGPDAPAPQRGGGKELRPLDPSTGRSKSAWETFPTGDDVKNSGHQPPTRN